MSFFESINHDIKQMTNPTVADAFICIKAENGESLANIQDMLERGGRQFNKGVVLLNHFKAASDKIQKRRPQLCRPGSWGELSLQALKSASSHAQRLKDCLCFVGAEWM
jgi:hypothetical protein